MVSKTENKLSKQNDGINPKKKPVIAPLDRNSMRGYGTGSFVEFLNGGEIKMLIEFIAHRDKEALYDPSKSKYEKRVIYYRRVKNPLYRDCTGKSISKAQYEKTKCGIKTRKQYRYVAIPKTAYKRYHLKDEDRPNKEHPVYDKSMFMNEYNNARKKYGGYDHKVGGRCW